MNSKIIKVESKDRDVNIISIYFAEYIQLVVLSLTI